jgi:glycosyltransferase involved in cell wall biosynthesis
MTAMTTRHLKVRTAKQYNVRYCIDLGQRNATVVRRPLTPLSRYVRAADAFCIVEPGFDLIHSFNAVPLLSRTPYFVTFEDYFPRLPEDRYIGWLHRFLARKAAGTCCLGLIALSQYGFRQFQQQNIGFPRWEALRNKTQVILPAVRTQASRPKKPGNRLRLIFVGLDFMRKGLTILLRTHAALRAEGIPVTTTVISGMRWRPDDYIGPVSPEIVNETFALLVQEGVHSFGTLSNADMLQRMREADFLVVPTFHDTFGYVFIEALSVGTPVIATRTCALPEIVDDGINGHLLTFDNDDVVGKWRWIYRSKEPDYDPAYQREVGRLSSELTAVLLQCWDDRVSYESKSAAALAKVDCSFNAERARSKLETLYADACIKSTGRASWTGRGGAK